MKNWRASEGSISPLGASWIADEAAWNFALFSKNASRVVLVLYTAADVKNPVLEVELDSFRNKTGPIWHCRLAEKEVRGACYYAYRVFGPVVEDNAFHWFSSDKVLLDPYAREVYFPPQFSRKAASDPGRNDGKAPLGVLLGSDNFDWASDSVAPHGSDLVIYELHVRGFTTNPNSKVKNSNRGTFLGVVEKIPYLKELGITAVELMPVFQFDPQERNYWGYMPLNFFAPHRQYGSGAQDAHVRNEFREMVRELHRAGIEVVLDVVYNHTCEGDHLQPVYSFKGIDNSQYYLASGDPSRPFANFTGCGNTLDAGSFAVRTLIVDSIRYWREEMHVDGFRFDLASILSRRSDGSVNTERPPIFGQIRSVANMMDARLIAEPWDAAGTFQLGRAFPGWLWMQWNAKFRDVAQRFIQGDTGLIPELMTRIYGSADLFPDELPVSCRPWQSVNYISSHDGSSLYDMVSYEQKNNWANGEENRDGCFEYKWNCGYEGDKGVPPPVMKLRKQQVKNFFCLLMLSNGTPMFRMGDEFLQTQGGNNNPYNQDNCTSWLNWERLEDNKDIFRFVKTLISFRKDHSSISRSHYWRSDVEWFGPNGGVDFSEDSRTLAYLLRGKSVGDSDLYVMINGGRERIRFTVPRPEGGLWKRVIDTSIMPPNDIVSPESAVEFADSHYVLEGHAVSVLVCE